MKTTPNPSPADRRRRLLLSLGTLGAVGAVSAGLLLRPAAVQARPLIEVWKSPTCGCCQDWIMYLQAEGFEVRAHDTGNAAKRASLGLPQKFGSCHTGVIDGYAIEGHVTAPDIRRLLTERPRAIGLAVPGMPRGTPGMDAPVYGGVSDPHDVLLVLHDGSAQVFRSVR